MGILNLAAAAGHESSATLQTLSAAIVAGILLMLISKRLKVSAITFLLLGGVALGPELLGIVQPDSLGKARGPLISLAVALILFEGGLTLDLDGYRRASKVIKRLLSVGVLITWVGTTATIYLLFHSLFPQNALGMSFLAASLVIVTGPTVIGPLLRRIRVQRNLNDILHWEGVLIDPIGVFIAILTFEFITGYSAEDALLQFLYRFFAGIVVGGSTGLFLSAALKRNWIPDGFLNITIVAAAVFIFAFDDALVPESGLLGVVIAGLVLGWKRPGPLKQIKEFKAEINELLIGTLFIVLAAQLRFEDLERFGMKGLLAVLIVVFVIRPLSIFVCTYGVKMSLREKIFLSYVAPRGIVAASMASLFMLSLQEQPAGSVDNAWFLVSFTFSVIAVTVVLQGLTAGALAKLLNLKLPAPTGWLIVGAHPFGRRIAGFLNSRANTEVVMIDVNRRAIGEARSEGFSAHYADARDQDLPSQVEYRGVGNVIALTDNEELNMIICQRWMSVVGRKSAFRWASVNPQAAESHEQPGIVAWSSLPKPSLVSNEMLRGDIAVTNGIVSEKAKQRKALVLLSFDEEHGIIIDPASRGGDLSESKAEGLMLRRDADYLVRSIKPELVLRYTDVSKREEVFERLVERIVSLQPRIDRKELLTEINEREKVFPTAIGHGVAVPHGYSSQTPERLCAVAQIPQGIPFDAPDEEPVKLIFLLVSPKGDPEGHLATMAEIARLVSDETVRERLISADQTVDVYTALMAARSKR